MRFEDFVGLRYLMAKRDRNMLSVITLISIGGVAVGVMALIVVLSVMGGFEADFRTKIIGSKSHVTISAVDGYLENYQEIQDIAKTVEKVEGVNAFIETEVMLNSPTNLQVAILRGVDFREITTTTKIAEYMEEGKLEYLENPDALPSITTAGTILQRGALTIHSDREDGDLTADRVEKLEKAGARAAIAFAGNKHGAWMAQDNEIVLPESPNDTLKAPEILADTPDLADAPDVLPNTVLADDGLAPMPKRNIDDGLAPMPKRNIDDGLAPMPKRNIDDGLAPMPKRNIDVPSTDDAELLAIIGEDRWVDNAHAQAPQNPAHLDGGKFDREPNAELLPLQSRSRQMKALPGLSADDVGMRRVGAIILGRELKNNLTLYLGAELNVMSPSGDIGPTGGLAKSRPFKLVGSYYSGMFDFDAKMGYISLKDAQALLGLGDMVTGIDVRCTQVEDSLKVRDALREKLKDYPNVRVDDWRTLNASLFSAIMLEKVAMFVILTFIILVASFNILCLLIMMVIEKAREIAIFKAMGTTDQSIVRIFVIQGAVIGILGTCIGLILGLGLCFIISEMGLKMPGEVHYITQIPVTVIPGEVIVICLASIGISLLATVLPSRMAVKLKPVDGLRCE